MTLLEKMKPEYLDRLQQVKAEYPSTYDTFIQALNDNYSWGDLKVTTASHLISFIYTAKEQIQLETFINQLSNLFN